MSVPNVGPERLDQYDPDDARKGNPAAVHCDLHLLGEVEAASTRAYALTHRFGGVRYALTRPGGSTRPGGPNRPDGAGGAGGSDRSGRRPHDGGESDPED